MFFSTDVLPAMLKDHCLMTEFMSGACSVWPDKSDYHYDRVVFGTIGPNGSTAYGYTIGEDHKKTDVKRWVRIDYDTLSVHHTFNSGYTMTETIANSSVLNNEKLMSLGFSKHELQLLATLVQHVKIRGANVLQN